MGVCLPWLPPVIFLGILRWRWVSYDMTMINVPDNKVHGANMGSIWGRQDPGGPHVGPMNFAICGMLQIRL